MAKDLIDCLEVISICHVTDSRLVQSPVFVLNTDDRASYCLGHAYV